MVTDLPFFHFRLQIIVGAYRRRLGYGHRGRFVVSA
jgi:hypothetical protein